MRFKSLFRARLRVLLVASLAALLFLGVNLVLAQGNYQLIRITTASDSARDSYGPYLSANGAVVAFESDSDFLGEGRPDNLTEIWLYDTIAMTYTRVTSASDSTRDSYDPTLSADGTIVAFRSDSDFLGEGLSDNVFETWLYDTVAMTYTRITSATDSGRDSFDPPVLSADGNLVAFRSDSDLVGQGVPDNQYEIWLARELQSQLTLIYHDLEDVVLPGEALYVAGDFNGWNPLVDPLAPNGDHSVFSTTITVAAPGLYEYKYVVYTDTVPTGPANWNWLQSQNRSLYVTNTIAHDYRFIQPGWVVLQWPPATTTTVGIPTENIYGQIWADDLTARPGPPRALQAQLGYGPLPNPGAWTTWSPLVWHSQQGDNDQFFGNIVPAAAGVFSYAVRFDGNWAPANPHRAWVYGDLDGAPYSPDQAGVLTVQPVTLTNLLLVPDSTNDRVMAFSPLNGDLIEPNFVPPDAVHLSTPKSAILHADGSRILVSDQLEDVVQAYDLMGNYLGVFAPIGGPDPAIMDNIRGISLRPNGNLLVTVAGGSNEDSVVEFDTAGNYLGVFIAAGSGGLDSPWYALQRATDWLVGGSYSDMVHSYDLNSGAYITDFASLSWPNQIAQASNGNVLVANYSGATDAGVHEFDANGNPVAYYDLPTLAGFRGVYELLNGNLLVATGTGVYEVARNNTVVETEISGVSCHHIELASFTAVPTYTLAVDVSPAGSGTVLVDPEQPYYDQGDSVSLTAVPTAGYSFDHWLGEPISGSTSPTETIVMMADYAVTAVFTEAVPPPTYTLTVDVSPMGSGTVLVDPEQPYYDQGDSVSLTAVPTAGYSFDHWLGEPISGSTSPTETIVMMADYAVAAVFTEAVIPPTYTLTVDVSPMGSGSVSLDPDQVFYDEGTEVSMSASPASAAWQFLHWTGDVISGSVNATETITMLGDYAVTAVFTPSGVVVPTYTLTVDVDPVGSGSVLVDPDQVFYDEGTEVSMSASPASAAWQFLHWTGDVISGSVNATETISMLGDYAVTAVFTPSGVVVPTYTLTVDVSPAGSGTVLVDPEQAYYDQGDSVSLTAVPTTDYIFDHWLGEPISGSAAFSDTVVIEMLADYAITAVFVEMVEEYVIYLPIVIKD